jgi:hypothetical protein
MTPLHWQLWACAAPYDRSNCGFPDRAGAAARLVAGMLVKVSATDALHAYWLSVRA